MEACATEAEAGILIPLFRAGEVLLATGEAAAEEVAALADLAVATLAVAAPVVIINIEV